MRNCHAQNRPSSALDSSSATTRKHHPRLRILSFLNFHSLRIIIPSIPHLLMIFSSMLRWSSLCLFLVGGLSSPPTTTSSSRNPCVWNPCGGSSLMMWTRFPKFPAARRESSCLEAMEAVCSAGTAILFPSPSPLGSVMTIVLAMVRVVAGVFVSL